MGTMAAVPDKDTYAETAGTRALDDKFKNPPISVPLDLQNLLNTTQPYSTQITAKSQLGPVEAIVGYEELEFFWRFWGNPPAPGMDELWAALKDDCLVHRKSAKFHFKIKKSIPGPNVETIKAPNVKGTFEFPEQLPVKITWP